MGVFGAGVGGGLLAAAGAAKGLGEGIAEGGEMGVKQQMIDRQAQQQLDRETMIQKMQQVFETGEKQKDRQQEMDLRNAEIQGQMNVAHFNRGNIATENQKNRDAAAALAKNHGNVQKTIAEGHDRARVTAAYAHAYGSGTGTRTDWTTPKLVQVPLTGTNPRTGKPYGDPKIDPEASRTVTLQTHKGLGLQFYQEQGGTTRFLWDSANNKPMPSTGKNPPQASIDYLNKNPGALRDFVQKYGQIPLSYNPSQRNQPAPNSPSAPQPSGAGSEPGDQATAPENEDPAESEPPPALPGNSEE